MARILLQDVPRRNGRYNDRTQPLRDDDRFPADFTEHECAVLFAAWQALNAFCPDGQGGAA